MFPRDFCGLWTEWECSTAFFEEKIKFKKKRRTTSQPTILFKMKITKNSRWFVVNVFLFLIRNRLAVSRQINNFPAPTFCFHLCSSSFIFRFFSIALKNWRQIGFLSKTSYITLKFYLFSNEKRNRKHLKTWWSWQSFA